ncbi:glycosyltransferase family 2 protein [Streptomyces sp. M19]
MAAVVTFLSRRHAESGRPGPGCGAVPAVRQRAQTSRWPTARPAPRGAPDGTLRGEGHTRHGPPRVEDPHHRHPARRAAGDRTARPAPPAPGAPVSVVVVAHNAMPELADCLASALEQGLPPGELEVVVVDDGSTDGTAAALDRLARDHPGLRTVRQPYGRGPGRARNAGLDVARGRYVLFLGPATGSARTRRAAWRRRPTRTTPTWCSAGRCARTARPSRTRRSAWTCRAPTCSATGCTRRSALDAVPPVAAGPARAALPRALPVRRGVAAGGRALLGAASVTVVADTVCYHLGPRTAHRAPAFADRAQALRLAFDAVARHTSPGRCGTP